MIDQQSQIMQTDFAARLGSKQLNELILILDVDGVTRPGVEDKADPHVIDGVKALLQHPSVDVTFLSGTHVGDVGTQDPWRSGNLPLNKIFGSAFNKEMKNDKVSVFGVLGAHRMRPDGSLEVVEEYSLETSFIIARLLVHGFLDEVLRSGNPSQKSHAQHIHDKLIDITLIDTQQPTHRTANEFQHLVEVIRREIDPDFRLINRGALVETHTSNPPWTTQATFTWLQQQLEQHAHLKLQPTERHVATGLAARGERGFNYLLVSKTHKGLATRKLIDQKKRSLPNAIVITIGDTQVDFPMHHHADVAFHVGLKSVWHNHPCPQCVLAQDALGQSGLFVKGTAAILQLLAQNMGRPIASLFKQPAPLSFSYHGVLA